MFELDQYAALSMSSMEAPLKRAHEAARPLVSCARILSEKRATWPADLIADTIQREMVSRETALCGGRQLTKSCSDDRKFCVLFMYHFRALTGHHSLSSAMEERDCMEGRTISRGWDDSRWFLAKKRACGRSLTLFFSQRM